MMLINSLQVTENLEHGELITVLEAAFKRDYQMPDRHHHFYTSPGSQENTLLLMPAWSNSYLGIKQVVVAPGNAQNGIPTIQGIYTLLDADTGTPLSILDAAALTSIRTACASALAAKYLAREDVKTLLVVGGGKVAAQLISAHLAIRNYQKVQVWMRRPEAFAAFKEDIGPVSIAIEWASDLEQAVKTADVISCATGSESPLIHGEWLRPGQHLDLIGSFKMNMREVDDEALVRSSLFVDSRHGALHESGELAVPLNSGVIREEDILADITELCRGLHKGRTSQTEITLFKSVGMAIEDLAAASLVYERMNKQQ